MMTAIAEVGRILRERGFNMVDGQILLSLRIYVSSLITVGSGEVAMPNDVQLLRRASPPITRHAKQPRII